MPDIEIIARVPSKVIVVGGDQHSGWLPAGAVIPLSKPLREVRFTFELHFDGSGFLLCYHSEDHSLYGDTWHESQLEAKRAAFEGFGVQLDEWESESDSAS